MKQKNSRGGTAVRLIRLIALAVFVVSAGYLFYWWWGSRENRVFNQQTAASYVSEASASASGASGASAESVTVDFAALSQSSDAVVGWLRVSGLDVIDYPVVQKDDSYYLTHAWDGSESKYGAIFMEEANAPDFSDYHTIIYGHNMKDDSMFGALDRYAEADFFAQNGGKVTVYTPVGTLVYQIFAVEYAQPAAAEVYTVGFSPGEEYEAFLQAMVARSLYDTGVSVSSTDHVLTLSTCASGGKIRFTVHAKLISGVEN